jgi:hypothetical protein
MSGVKGRVGECYARFRVPGMAMIKLSISHGRVTWATLVGELAGTPEGTCIEEAVKTATFPSAVNTNDVNYPFMLR